MWKENQDDTWGKTLLTANMSAYTPYVKQSKRVKTVFKIV